MCTCYAARSSLAPKESKKGRHPGPGSVTALADAGPAAALSLRCTPGAASCIAHGCAAPVQAWSGASGGHQVLRVHLLRGGSPGRGHGGGCRGLGSC